mmetsp:Transcript_29987/g.45903  ORF Transcript_29987/g.45903 Transcript_29987/m.45903 type:complete len:207 (-) Transcript_29987:502-1122(-)
MCSVKYLVATKTSTRSHSLCVLSNFLSTCVRSLFSMRIVRSSMVDAGPTLILEGTMLRRFSWRSDSVSPGAASADSQESRNGFSCPNRFITPSIKGSTCGANVAEKSQVGTCGGNISVRLFISDKNPRPSMRSASSSTKYDKSFNMSFPSNADLPSSSCLSKSPSRMFCNVKDTSPGLSSLPFSFNAASKRCSKAASSALLLLYLL